MNAFGWGCVAIAGAVCYKHLAFSNYRLLIMDIFLKLSCTEYYQLLVILESHHVSVEGDVELAAPFSPILWPVSSLVGST